MQEFSECMSGHSTDGWEVGLAQRTDHARLVRPGRFMPRFFDPYNKRYTSLQSALQDLDPKKNDNE